MCDMGSHWLSYWNDARMLLHASETGRDAVSV